MRFSTVFLIMFIGGIKAASLPRQTCPPNMQLYYCAHCPSTCVNGTVVPPGLCPDWCSDAGFCGCAAGYVASGSACILPADCV